MHLITYASAVTRQMLPFSNLEFFSMPPLPQNWAAPQWLKSELGLFAGRLNFEWAEYDALCEFLGANDEEVDENDVGNENSQDNANDNETKASIENDKESDIEEKKDDGENPVTAKPPVTNVKPSSSTFCPRPLIFLQDWLAIRRRGQDIVHTPMGFLAQSKPLQANHPFFGGNDGTDDKPRAPVVADGSASPSAGVRGRGQAEGNTELEDFDGVDDMGANVGDGDEDEVEEEVAYGSSELGLSEDGEEQDEEESSFEAGPSDTEDFVHEHEPGSYVPRYEEEDVFWALE